MIAAYGFLLFLVFMAGSVVATWYSMRSADRAFDDAGDLP